jgi:hypothetical protein
MRLAGRKIAASSWSYLEKQLAVLPVRQQVAPSKHLGYPLRSCIETAADAAIQSINADVSGGTNARNYFDRDSGLGAHGIVAAMAA